MKAVLKRAFLNDLVLQASASDCGYLLHVDQPGIAYIMTRSKKGRSSVVAFDKDLSRFAVAWGWSSRLSRQLQRDVPLGLKLHGLELGLILAPPPMRSIEDDS